MENASGGGLYSLVGNNRFTSVSLIKGVVRVTPSARDYIPFQPGDVQGFLLEDALNKKLFSVVLRTAHNFSSEVVWYGSQNAVPPTALVGSKGIVNTVLYGAPVISAATGESPNTTIVQTIG